jgi:WW domain-binding protein 2
MGKHSDVSGLKIVYLPTNPTSELQSFSAPILNLEDTYVRAPFFGANYWMAFVKPVTDGGIPPQHPAVEIRMTFREGGAYDYHTVFEQIKERLQHAVTLAREQGRNVGSSGVLDPADLANLDLEQLPAYEPTNDVGHSGPAGGQGFTVSSFSTIADKAAGGSSGPNPGADTPKPEHEIYTPPNDPPPGYEEASHY